VSERPRFYMDERVDSAITAGLRQRGVDVLTAQEAGLRTADDEAHLSRGKDERRVIFAQDADLLRLHASGVEHAGIVYAPQGSPIGPLVRGLMLTCEILEPDDMQKHVEFL
jgi:hypothetical protein